MNHKTVRLSIEMPSEQHKQLKAWATLRGESIKEFVLGKIFEDAKKEKKFTPNKTTVKALQDIKSKKNLNKYSDVKDLFEKLK